MKTMCAVTFQVSRNVDGSKSLGYPWCERHTSCTFGRDLNTYNTLRRWRWIHGNKQYEPLTNNSILKIILKGSSGYLQTLISPHLGLFKILYQRKIVIIFINYIAMNIFIANVSE